MPTQPTTCVAHRLPEDQPSPHGQVCRECLARLRDDPPQGACRGFWESQPLIVDGEPCAVFTLAWDNFQIRSLHSSTALSDLEREASEILTRDS